MESVLKVIVGKDSGTAKELIDELKNTSFYENLPDKNNIRNEFKKSFGNNLFFILNYYWHFVSDSHK